MNSVTEEPSADGRSSSGKGRTLKRSSDRRIAGVAGGLAETFDVDPTWVRLGFVISMLFTLGTALLAYVVLWVVLPSDEGPSMIQGGKRDQPVLLVVAGLAVILLIAWSIGDFGFGPLAGGVVLPLLLIGAGIVMLRQRSIVPDSVGRGDTDQGRAPPTETAASPVVPTSSPASSVVEESAPGTGLAVPDEPGALTDLDEVEDRGDLPPLFTSGAGRGDGGGDEPPTPSDEGSSEPKAVKEKAPSVITPIVLSLMLIASGIGLALHLTDTVEVQLTAMMGIYLLLIASGLVVSAFVGRATGLIPLGIIATLGLLVASVVDPIIDDGTGERDYVVVTLAELLPEYRLGVGDMTVDLSGVDIGAEQREVEIELAIGKLVVYLPAEPALDLTIDNDIGQIGFTDESGRSQQSFETTDNSGVGNDLRVVEESDVGTGRLKVTVKNRIGDVEVIRVGS